MYMYEPLGSDTFGLRTRRANCLWRWGQVVEDPVAFGRPAVERSGVPALRDVGQAGQFGRMRLLWFCQLVECSCCSGMVDALVERARRVAEWNETDDAEASAVRGHCGRDQF